MARFLSLTIPTTLAPGSYFLQVRVHGSTADYAHTVEVYVDPTGGTPTVVATPAAGSAPGTYPPGTWVTVNSDVRHGKPGPSGYSYAWKLNGATVSTVQLNTAGTNSIVLTVSDSTGTTVSSNPLTYTIATQALKIVSYRREPVGDVKVGALVNFFATFAGGTPPYNFTALPGGSMTSATGTTSEKGELLVGSFTYSNTGTFQSSLNCTDSGGSIPATGNLSITVTS